MKALSIRQPWAWAIVNAGKRVENRTWETRYRGPILIHAAKGVTKREYEQFASFWQNFPRRPLQSYPRPPSFDALQRGGVVARAEVIGCISDAAILDRTQRPWFFGPHALVLDQVEPIPFVECKGMLGFFDVPDTRIKIPC